MRRDVDGDNIIGRTPTADSERPMDRDGLRDAPMALPKPEDDDDGGGSSRNCKGGTPPNHNNLLRVPSRTNDDEENAENGRAGTSTASVGPCARGASVAADDGATAVPAMAPSSSMPSLARTTTDEPAAKAVAGAVALDGAIDGPDDGLERGTGDESRAEDDGRDDDAIGIGVAGRATIVEGDNVWGARATASASSNVGAGGRGGTAATCTGRRPTPAMGVPVPDLSAPLLDRRMCSCPDSRSPAYFSRSLRCLETTVDGRRGAVGPGNDDSSRPEPALANVVPDAVIH